MDQNSFQGCWHIRITKQLLRINVHSSMSFCNLWPDGPMRFSSYGSSINCCHLRVLPVFLLWTGRRKAAGELTVALVDPKLGCSIRVHTTSACGQLCIIFTLDLPMVRVFPVDDCSAHTSSSPVFPVPSWHVHVRRWPSSRMYVCKHVYATEYSTMNWHVLCTDSRRATTLPHG